MQFLRNNWIPCGIQNTGWSDIAVFWIEFDAEKEIYTFYLKIDNKKNTNSLATKTEIQQK